MNDSKSLPSMNPAMKAKMRKTMGEFKHGTLHGGSSTGPVVTNRKQAVAIGLNQVRRRRIKGRGIVRAATGGAMMERCPRCGSEEKEPGTHGMRCAECKHDLVSPSKSRFGFMRQKEGR